MELHKRPFEEEKGEEHSQPNKRVNLSEPPEGKGKSPQKTLIKKEMPLLLVDALMAVNIVQMTLQSKRSQKIENSEDPP